ncbi:MAG: PAS domain S-box protein [Rhodospirillaceae bacterium]|nr:PAS domain S-box protein [Rhodospirillaceae bacterium]MBT6136838.1 PAS domain S-box protein [Rhodospirillaceae bacterium]
MHRARDDKSWTLLSTALDNISQGILVYDENLIVIAFNQRVLEILNLPRDRFSVGGSFEDWVRYTAEQGGYGKIGSVDERVSKRLALARSFQPYITDQTRFDDKVVEVSGNPISSGGYVTTYTDVTERKKIEVELRNSQEATRALADNLPEFITLKDPDGLFQFVNKRFEEWTGFDRDDVVGKTVFDIYPAAQAQEFDALDREAIDGRAVIAREIDLAYPDGQERPVISTRFPVISQSDEMLGLGTVNIDLTDLKNAEQALKKRTGLVELLHRTARDANRSKNLNEAMQNALENVCAYNGWPIGHAYVRSSDEEDVLAPTSIWHLDDPKRFATFKDVTERTTFTPGVGLPGRVMASGQSEWIVDIGNDPDFLRGQFGRDLDIRTGFACPVLMGSIVVAVLEFFTPEASEPDQVLLDSLVHVGTILGRVGEREHSEKELRQSEEQFRGAFETSAAGMALHAIDGRYLKVNQTFCDILGYTEHELLRMNWRDISFADDVSKSESLDDESASAARDNYIIEKRYVCKDGKIVWARVFSAHLRNAEGVAHLILGQIYDITELKQAEETLLENEKQLRRQVLELTDREERLESQAVDLVALAKDLATARDELGVLNAQKDKFFSIIAHDLRNPFNQVLGFSSLLSRGAANLDANQVAEYSDAVHDAAQQVFRLLEDLLEWSRLQMGQMEFNPQPIDLRDMIDKNMKLFDPVAKTKGVRISQKKRQSLAVFADDHMVDTVIRNLIDNAIKFTPENGDITVSVRRSGKSAVVEVADTGAGMPEDVVDRLFRLGEATSTMGTGGETGTGLGLHLCKDLVERQGGQMDVESKVGEGSVFRFTLPLTSL